MNVSNGALTSPGAQVEPSAVNGSAVQLDDSAHARVDQRRRAAAVLWRRQADAARRVEDERAVGVEVPDEPALARRRARSIHETYGVLPKNVMSGRAGVLVRARRPGCRR